MFFPENPGLSRTTLEKTIDTIPRKRPDRRQEGRTERPYFVRVARLPPGIQKSLIQERHR